MKKASNTIGLGYSFLCALAGMALLAFAWPVLADDSVRSDSEPVIYLPLAEHGKDAGLAFDLAGSDDPKLQVQLARPLRLGVLGETLQDGPADGSVMAGTALEYSVNEDLSFGALAGSRHDQRSFLALGSIHCENGTLSAVSYRASQCYFIDDRATASTGVLSLGTRYRLARQATARINLFRTETAYHAGNARLSAQPYPHSLLDAGFAGGLFSDLPFSGLGPIQRMQRLDAEVTGIDLEFQVGISTDRAGDMVLGLQLTRVLDSSLDVDGAWFNAPGLHNWTIAEPFDTARLSFDWRRGAFSGGIESYYRSPIEFMNNGRAGDVATFDVHFTWRAPWNASLSVGASNVLNAGAEDRPRNENQLNDPFESVYGRIPYVRYKQDL